MLRRKVKSLKSLTNPRSPAAALRRVHAPRHAAGARQPWANKEELFAERLTLGGPQTLDPKCHTMAHLGCVCILKAYSFLPHQLNGYPRVHLVTVRQ